MLKGNFKFNLAVPPGVLELKVGDTCRVRCTFSYSGPAVSGKLYVAIWHPSWYDPHDEVAHGEKSFSLPTTTTPKDYSYDVDIYVGSGIAPGWYGLYAKIVGVPGPDIFSPYYENVIKIVEEVPVGITFSVSIWGIPDFGSYQKWCCYYWDPGIGDFVGDGKWYYSYQKIGFSNVKSGGYLAVFLLRNSTVSAQYTSPTFEAVDGGSYTYDVEMGKIYG